MSENLITLQREVESKILTMKDKVKLTKLKATILKVSGLFFAALTTVLVGISNGEVNLSTYSLITSSLLTLIVGMESHFSFKEQWVRQKWTLLKLYQIQNKLNLMSAEEKLRSEVISIYINDYLSIWDMDLSHWEKIRSRDYNSLSTSEKDNEK